MIGPLSNLTSWGYHYLAKPILFSMSPDRAHTMMLGAGGRIQSSSVVKSLINKTWSYNNNAYLQQTFFGSTYTNPVGLSAGFDKNITLPGVMKAVGFGFMEAGSITAQPTEGNPRPWFYRLPHSKSLVVHAGLANDGADSILKNLSLRSPETFNDFPLNVSIAYTNSANVLGEKASIQDYITSISKVQKNKHVSMITLNISCPNTYGGEPFSDPAKLQRLLKQVDALHVDQPLFLKMPSDLLWAQFDALLEVASTHDVQGITVCNLAKTRALVDPRDTLPDDVKGGLSGAPVRETSNYFIQHTYKKYKERFIIIGVGGIFSAQDAYTKIKLGASLVELITGMIYFGPQLIGRINKDLVALLQADGFSSISEAIGRDNQ